MPFSSEIQCERPPEIEVVLAEEEGVGAKKRNWCFPRLPMNRIRAPSLSKHGLGIFLILCVTVIWVASSEWVQFIFGMLNFNKPYFLTYFNTSGFALWNLGYACSPSWRQGSWRGSEDPREIMIHDEQFTSFFLPETEEEEEGKGEGHRTRSTSRNQKKREGIHRKAKREEDTRPRKGWDSFRQHDNVPPLSQMRDEPLPFPTFLVCPSAGLCSTPEGKEEERRIAAASSLNEDPSREASPLPFPLPVPTHRHRHHLSLSSHSLWKAEGSVLSSRKEEEKKTKEVNEEGEVASSLPPPSIPDYTIRTYSRRRIWEAATVFCPFWFFGNYLFNLSLSYTSVASNTIMSAMGTVWTLVLSRVFLQIPIGGFQLAGAVICVSGSILVGLSATSETRSTALGNLMAIISSFFYAVYTLVLRWWLPDDERYSMGQVFGAVGVINFMCFWPGFFALNWMGVESFSWPGMQQLLPLVLNALIGTNLSDVLWARSVILTSPVVATMGLSLTTPLSMVVDAMLHGSSYPVGYVLGAIFVVIGFIVANAS